MSTTELVIIPVDETEHEALMRTQIALIIERLTAIEEKCDKTHKVFDIAFSRFETMAKSPVLGALFGGMTKKS